jgi:hypothetical protein
MEEIFIKQTNTTIRVDEGNKVLLAFDVVDGIVDEQSEGILAEVSPFMYDEIKNGLFINPQEYGVDCVDK